MTRPVDPGDRPPSRSGEPGGDASPGQGEEGEAYRLVKDAVDGILAQNEEARRAHEAMQERGLDEARAREEIARVLIAVMYHVGRESRRLEEAGGGSGLRSEAFRRLAEGETADQIFGS